MAELIIDRRRLGDNIRWLSQYFKQSKMQWTLIIKVLSGNKRVLKDLLTPETIEHIHSLGDSRLTGLRAVKEILPDIRTMYIKPPAVEFADQIVRYADISLNTSLRTIEALNKAAGKLGKVHDIVIMIELGELREGVLGENLLSFYNRIFELPNIRIIGLGTNLGCLFGVEPTRDKLIQLSLYKQLLETKFDHTLELISGGTSITLPLIGDRKIPKAVNHFRVGEAAFLGTSPLNQEIFGNLDPNVFEFHAQLLEIEEKEGTPDGVIGEGSIGHGPESAHIGDLAPGETSSRALVDFGLIDVDPADLVPQDAQVSFFGSTSDMTVYDLGKNRDENSRPRYRVGQQLPFTPNYMGVARLMSSKFVDKRVI